jgi:DNA-binding beta-propeller fold protein YncE
MLANLVKNCRRLLAAGAMGVMMCAASGANAAVVLEHVWTHEGGGKAHAEIVAFDAVAGEFLVVNGAARCVTRLDARSGKELGRLDVSHFGDPTSVAASRGLIAVAVVAPVKTDPGNVVLFRSASDGAPAAVVRVPALPDMVTFTPDGRYVIVANEGEPSDDYAIDPEGAVSVIDVGRGVESAVALTADFLAFNAEREALDKTGVRVSGPNAGAVDGRATLAQDAEPEYIAVAPDGRTAWVTLQENNALAEIDVATARVKRIVGLGWKDHSRSGQGFDASDRDGGVQIRNWPVRGMYQPDGIAAFEVDGAVYLATANEGDTREYGSFTDQMPLSSAKLDPSLLLADADLQQDAKVGRLLVSSVDGDSDGDGKVDRLLASGARSLAIWNANGELMYDSGDAIERYVAEHLKERFNVDSEGGQAVDERSPEKGPEPESVVVGRVGDATLAFVGLERTSAIAVFDVTRPASARLLSVVPLALTKDATGGPHIAPEGLCFVPADRSPTGEPLLAVACEVTGTTVLFRVKPVAVD